MIQIIKGQKVIRKHGRYIVIKPRRLNLLYGDGVCHAFVEERLEQFYGTYKKEPRLEFESRKLTPRELRKFEKYFVLNEN